MQRAGLLTFVGGKESVYKAGRAVARKQRYANHSFLAFRSPDPSVLGVIKPSAEARRLSGNIGGYHSQKSSGFSTSCKGSRLREVRS